MRFFTIEHVHRFDGHTIELFSSLRNDVAIMREEIMTISAEVQNLLDKARSNTSLTASVDHGVAAMRIQISQLLDRLNTIPVAPAVSLSAEDKDALLEAAGELDNSAVTLKNDIPANVPEGQPDPAANAGGGTAQPLAGTGDVLPPDHPPPAPEA